MENAIDQQVDMQGKWLRQAVEIIFSLPIDDVLSYGYSLSQIEEHLSAKKLEIRSNILKFIKEKRQYHYIETNEPVDLETFIDYELEFEGTINKFKSHLKTASAADLRKYEIAIFEKDFFFKNDLFN